MLTQLSQQWTSVARRSSAYRVTAIYLAISVLWILISDQLVDWIVRDPALQTTVNTLKGWGFVGVTAGLLYALIRRDTAALHASEEKYRTLVEAADDAILLTDLQGRQLFANSAYYTSLGYAPGEADSPDGFSLIHPDDAPGLRDKFGELLAHGHLTTEYRVRHQDGRWINRSTKSSVIYDGQQRPVSILAIARDITERKQVEEDRRKLSRAVEQSPVSIVITDAQGNIEYVNPKFSEVSGYSAAEALGQNPRILKSGDRPAAEYQQLWQTITQGGEWRGEFHNKRKNGELYWEAATISPVFDSQGRLTNFVGIKEDITARKQWEAQQAAALQALRASEAKFRSYIEYAPLGVIVLDAAGHVVDVNSAVTRLLGYTKDELKERAFSDLLMPTSLEAGRKYFQGLSRLGSLSGELSLQTKAGAALWIIISSVKLADQHFMAYILDMTARQQAEEALQESEARYRELVQNANSAILRWRSDGAILFFNEYAQALFGYSAAEILGQPVGRLVPDHESTGGDLTSLVQDIVAHPERFVNNINENICQDGRRVWMTWTNKPIRDEQGRVAEILAVGTDITDRIQAAEARRESEARLNGIVGSAMDAIISVDQEQRILLFNTAAEQMFRCAATAAIGQPLERFIPDRHRAAHRQHIQRFGATGDTSRSMGALRPLSAVRTDGVEFPIEASISQMDTDDGKLYTVILRDITERKRAEEALQQSEQKYSALFEKAAVPAALTKLPAGTFADVNEAFQTTYGYRREDVIGKTSVEIGLAVPEERARTFLDLQHHAVLHDNEKHLLTRSGELRLAAINVSKVVINGQDFAITTIHDITERKRAEEDLRASEARYRALFENMAEGYAYCQMLYENGQPVDWIYLTVNDSFETLTGLRRVVGRRVSEVIPGIRATDPELFVVYSRVALTGQHEKLEVYVEALHMWFSISIYCPEREYFVAVFDVITARKQAEEEILRLNATLEQRVVERTVQLEAVNQELEAFAYSISHDLRAPLRAIDGFSRIILEDYAARLDDEGRRLFTVVRNNTQRMDQLITDLLALSRVSRSPLSATRFDMTVLVHDVYRTLVSPDDAQHVTFTMMPLPEACGDPALLRQVWANLLSNALKYTRHTADPRIQVGSHQADHVLTYFVKDNGVGFNPEYAHKLFGVFQRLHSEKEFEGTGVGLAIVQRIVQRHGGRVWAEGQLQQGATFYFSLPCPEAGDER